MSTYLQTTRKYFREIKDENDVGAMQSDLNEVFNWSGTWLLKFHRTKCKMLPIYNKNKAYDVNSKIFGKVRTFINQSKRF